MAAKAAGTALLSIPPAAYMYERFSGPSSPHLPVSYDENVALHFRSRPFTVLSRIGAIVVALPPLAVSPSPDLLTDTLISLGPAFIKLGQQLSIRPDLLPPPYLPALAKLHDNCPAFDTVTAHGFIEAELGSAVDALFPGGLELVAAASLGQVYRGELATGGTVAVKVQRPDVAKAVALDLYIVHSLAKTFDFLTSPLREVTDWTDLVGTFAAGSYGELDYKQEARCQEAFREELTKASKINVYVPRVYKSHSTGTVLTTEWIDGVKLSDCSDATINKLIPVGVEFFMVQLLTMGTFHSDP